MEKLMKSNDWKYRLARTILQGVIGVLIANLDLILGYTILDAPTRAFVVALVMAVLSPVMAQLGEADKETGNA